MRKWIIIAVIAVVVIVISVSGYGLLFKKKAAQPTTANESTTKVTKGTLQVTVSGSGSVEPVDVENVRAVDNGQINEVLVKQGDRVKKGQTLITFKATDNSDQIKQEQLNLARDRMDLDAAQKTFKEQAIGSSVDTLDSLKTNIQKLQINIEQSQLKIQSYEKDQTPADPIVSPIDGVISTLNVNAGQQISSGAIAAIVSNYSDLQVVIQADELDINKVKKDQSAIVTVDALPGKNIKGTVTDIADQGQATNGVSLYDVTIHLQNNPQIKSGMTAEAEIIAENKKDVLLLPIEAVHQLKGRNVVFLPVQAGATNSRNMKPVEVGSHNENYIEITKGLNEGEQVLIQQSSTSNSSNRQFRAPGIGGAFGGGGRSRGGS